MLRKKIQCREYKKVRLKEKNSFLFAFNNFQFSFQHIVEHKFNRVEKEKCRGGEIHCKTLI
jgi:hypothetical protein